MRHQASENDLGEAFGESNWAHRSTAAICRSIPHRLQFIPTFAWHRQPQLQKCHFLSASLGPALIVFSCSSKDAGGLRPAFSTFRLCHEAEPGPCRPPCKLRRPGTSRFHAGFPWVPVRNVTLALVFSWVFPMWWFCIAAGVPIEFQKILKHFVCRVNHTEILSSLVLKNIGVDLYGSRTALLSAKLLVSSLDHHARTRKLVLFPRNCRM